MRLLCTKQTLRFVPAGGGEGVTVSPKSGIQEVPDWLRDTDTFKVAAPAGVIVDLDNLRAPTPAAEVAEPAVVATPAEDKLPGLTGKVGGKAKAA